MTDHVAGPFASSHGRPDARVGADRPAGPCCPIQRCLMSCENSTPIVPGLPSTGADPADGASTSGIILPC